MVDSAVVGCCWIELPKGKFRVREEKSLGETNPQHPSKVGVVYVLTTRDNLPRLYAAQWLTKWPAFYMGLLLSVLFCPSGDLVSV